MNEYEYRDFWGEMMERIRRAKAEAAKVIEAQNADIADHNKEQAQLLKDSLKEKTRAERQAGHKPEDKHENHKDKEDKNVQKNH